MSGPIEILTPIMTVMQVLDDLPLTLGRFTFGVRASVGKADFQSFNARLQHASYKLGAVPGAWMDAGGAAANADKIINIPLDRDDITDERCAWFLSREWPLVVDAALVQVPRTIKLTRGSQIRIATIVYLPRPRVMGLLPRAIQIISLEPPSDPQIPFNRVPNGYVYEPEDGTSGASS